MEEDVVDIGELVNRFNYVRDKAWPLGLLSQKLGKIRRWENYPVSLAVVTLSCIATLLPKVLLALLSLVSLLVILAGHKRVPKSKHKRQEIPPDVVPRLINEDKEALKSTASAQKSREESVKQFRQLLKTANNFLILFADYIDTIKSVFSWNNEKHSVCLCVILFGMIIALMWIPVSAILSLSMAIFFCWNKYFLIQTKKIFSRRVKPTSQSGGRLLPTSDFPSSLPVDGSILREELSNSGDSATGAASNGSPSKRDKGVCHKCRSAFNIIKRKHSCSSCGYFYCATCTVKVCRAELGATSPAAFQETVRVCLECKSVIDNNKTDCDSVPNNT